MHVLSDRHYAESLRETHLVRIGRALGSDGLEPTLVLKTSTLLLKYIVRGGVFDIRVVILRDRAVLYALRILDDPSAPVTLWSLVEDRDELTALGQVLRGAECWVHLFNEAIVNTCSARVRFEASGKVELATARIAESGTSKTYRKTVDELLNDLHCGSIDLEMMTATPQAVQWTEMKSVYITNNLSRSTISLMSESEGAQQEELAVWLTDWLSPSGAVRSPQVHLASGVRELCDVLMNHEYGVFLVESKTLAILDHGSVPDRQKLRKNTLKNVRKACGQLQGAWRQVLAGARIATLAGVDIVVTRDNPAQAIVLVPDLSLLADCTEMGGELIRTFTDNCGALLHLLDPGQLIRLAQNADFIARQGERTTPMMAFDFVLMKRWQKSVELSTPYFQFEVRTQ
jgi:hypothetical protein